MNLAFGSDGYVLTEALHRFHAEVNSPYRKALRTMAYVICYAEEYKLLTDIERSKIPAPKITPEKVELYPDQYYDLYVFYKPFNKVHGLDIIHQLKIYFKTTNNTFDRDTYIVCNNYDESEFCPELRPLFKAEPNKTKIDIMSIVCQESLDLDTLTGIFAHEIKHGLFAIKEQRRQKHTENSNWKSEQLKRLCTSLSKYGVYTPFNMTQYDTFEAFSSFEYFCQDSEIESHLESMYAECMKYCNGQLKDETKAIILEAIKILQ